QEVKAAEAVSQPASIQYHLLVTHIDFGAFATYLEKAPSGTSGEEVMPRLEGRLDRLEFPSAAVIPGRDLQLLTNAGYGSSTPSRMIFSPLRWSEGHLRVGWTSMPRRLTGCRLS